MISQYKSTVPLSLSKRDLRARMRSARQQISADSRRRQSQSIARRLQGIIDKESPARIGLYLATAYEVNLDSVIDQCLAQGREVYLPHLGDPQAPFRRFLSWDEIETGPLDLRQPSSKALAADAASLHLIVVPGLAFDRDGNRLGHGGGWYDKVLSNAITPQKRVVIGVCFEEQIVRTVPYEPFDVRMDMVVSPSANNVDAA
jgi:5-formyltetrahydrofolate cyclo-ligase